MTAPRITDAVRTIEGEGMVVRRALNPQAPRDPFLLLDHMGPTQYGPGEAKGAPNHPHRGFETVTYVLEGDWEHRDSLGNSGYLKAGSVQWMTAGSGLIHSEMPSHEVLENGGTVHGLQLWVNLPAAHKMDPPRYQDIDAEDIPEVKIPGGFVRVIAGTFQGTQAVIDTVTPITYLHAHLASGNVQLPVPEGHDAFAYVVRGSGSVDGQPIQEGQRIDLDGAEEILVEGDLDIILVTGQPIGEPVFQWGPFVMNNKAQIVQAIDDYQQGRMGQL